MRCRLCFKEKPIFIFSSKNRHGRKLLSQEEFDLYRCPDCDVIFTDIEPDGTYYTKYYPKDYYSSPIENNFFLKKNLSFFKGPWI